MHKLGKGTHMGPTNSLDKYIRISVALLCDVQKLHDEVFTKSALEKTVRILKSRLAEEGMGFLTETLPRLGKRLDKSLANASPLDLVGLRLATQPGSKLPKFLGELFLQVYSNDGLILPAPSVASVRSLRQVLYAFYKLELGYTPELEQSVVQEFERTDASLSTWNSLFAEWRQMFDERNLLRDFVFRLERRKADLQDDLANTQEVIAEYKTQLDVLNARQETERSNGELLDALESETLSYLSGKPLSLLESDILETSEQVEILEDQASRQSSQLKEIVGQLRWIRVLRRARILLWRLFRTFDPLDIMPSHGPGAVSTREQLHEKWKWTHIHDRLSQIYPIDEFFFVNLDHVCDRLNSIQGLGDKESPARVCLVPKDSRGPRLISCEPLENQWIQQGLSRAVVSLVESHLLTRYEVHFTDQTPNQKAALHGSRTRGYATLDLKEASDRVCLELVRVLFPSPLLEAMEACRSQETQLPCGKRVKLQKFAPMGSALCFPVMALTIWSLLRAGLTDAATVSSYKPRKLDEVEECCLVYGDDVIVTRAKAPDAINILESFGLLINRDKSCYGEGFFRESCGEDAFIGESVTPVRFRTTWTSRRCPSSYQSYVAYANAFYKRGFRNTHQVLVELLYHLYGPLADADWFLPVPSVIGLPEEYRSHKVRANRDYQRLERRVLDVRPCVIKRPVDGWMMLLRTLTSKVSDPSIADRVVRNMSLIIEKMMIDTNDIPRRRGVAGLDPLEGSPFSACSYTKRQAEVLAWSWR